MVKLKGMMLAAMGGMLMGLMACGGQQWSEQQVDSFMLVTQKGGPSLGSVGCEDPDDRWLCLQGSEP